MYMYLGLDIYTLDALFSLKVKLVKKLHQHCQNIALANFKCNKAHRNFP